MKKQVCPLLSGLLLLVNFSICFAQTISFSGTVYDDGTEAPTAGTPTGKLGDKQLYAIYSSGEGFDLNAQPANPKVVAAVPVAADGTYRFTNVPTLSFGQVSLAISTTTVGAPTPSAFLPNTIRAGAIDNRTQRDFSLTYIFITAIADQATINFRFNQRPTANSITAPIQVIVDNGATQVTVPPLTGSDPEDGVYDGVSGTTTVLIPFSLQNPLLIYKGKAIQSYEYVFNFSNIYYRLDNYDPTQLKVIPAKGQTTALFQYYVVDAANRFSANPGTVTLTFSSSPLPVDLIRFEGKWIKGLGNELNWQTAWEQDNDYFDIQRSSDAKSFESIGRLVGKGTTSTGQTYNFVDQQPLTDVSYYRLKQFDLGGKVSYSKTIAVRLGEAQAGPLVIYPNPSSDFIQLQPANRQTIVEAKIYSESGQQVLNQLGANLSIDIRSLATGIYVAEVKTSAGQVLRQRLLKQ